jgi:pimeloyl-ACP methyl ester carboxylesterase
MYPAGIAGVSTRILSLGTGVRVRVAESGPRDGQPILLLHGWAATIYTFRHALELLPAHGFRVISPDMRGFGLSDKPITRNAYSLDAYLDDLAALLEVLELDRLILGGQSMGGGVALHFALRNPRRVSHLVLINPIGLAPVAFVKAMRLVPQQFVNTFGAMLAPRAIVEWVLRRIAYGDPSLVTDRTVHEYWSPTQQPGFVRAGRAALSEFHWEPVDPTVLQSLSAPAVVILGEQDRLIREAAPAARVMRVAEVHSMVGGHCVHEEHPDAVYPLVTSFLRREPATHSAAQEP